MTANKQLQRTVTSRRGDGASAPFHSALAPRVKRHRAAAELRRYAARSARCVRLMQRSIVLIALPVLAVGCSSLNEFAGEVVSADLSQTPVDGDAVLMIATGGGAVEELHVAACEARCVADAWSAAIDPAIIGRSVLVRADRDDARGTYYIAQRGSIDVLD
jgi:hypothetical protein